MAIRESLLALALLATQLAFSAAIAAPHEINVFTDEMEEPGDIGLEMHVNYARGRETPDFETEIPPNKIWRVMPELVVGLRKNWEIGLHLPMQRDREGKLHADGFRVRLKHLFQKEESAAFFAGINVEWGYDQPHLSEDRHNFELRGIFGWRTEQWLVAVNPIFAWVLKGPNQSGKPDFEASFKVAREVRPGWAVGIEHYASVGRFGNFAQRREQDHMLFFAVDYEGKGWGVNFGIGTGLTPVSDDRVIKAVIGIPFK